MQCQLQRESKDLSLLMRKLHLHPRMLGSRQLDEILNHLTHSCCFTFCESRVMLMKLWVSEEVLLFLFLLSGHLGSMDKQEWLALSLQHHVTNFNTLLSQIILPWPNYFSLFDQVLHFLISFILCFLPKMILLQSSFIKRYLWPPFHWNLCLSLVPVYL